MENKPCEWDEHPFLVYFCVPMYSRSESFEPYHIQMLKSLTSAMELRWMEHMLSYVATKRNVWTCSEICWPPKKMDLDKWHWFPWTNWFGATPDKLSNWGPVLWVPDFLIHLHILPYGVVWRYCIPEKSKMVVSKAYINFMFPILSWPYIGSHPSLLDRPISYCIVGCVSN